MCKSHPRGTGRKIGKSGKYGKVDLEIPDCATWGCKPVCAPPQSSCLRRNATPYAQQPKTRNPISDRRTDSYSSQKLGKERERKHRARSSKTYIGAPDGCQDVPPFREKYHHPRSHLFRCVYRVSAYPPAPKAPFISPVHCGNILSATAPAAGAYGGENFPYGGGPGEFIRPPAIFTGFPRN